MNGRASLVPFLLSKHCSLGASLVHAGILLGGYEHSRAAIAEGVIGSVLALVSSRR
jgi:hypothetical protein